MMTSSMFIPTPLPVELLDLILSFLSATDQSTLSACTLVGHQWYLLARARLFRAIVFKPCEEHEHSALSFWNLMQTQLETEGSSLQSAVKSLTLHVGIAPWGFAEDYIPQILPLLTNLSSLTIHGFARLTDIPPRVISSLRLTMTNIKRLELDCIEFKTDVFEVFDLLYYPPSESPPSSSVGSSQSLVLKDLVLTNILPYSAMPMDQDDPPALCPITQIRNLSLILNPMVMRAAFAALIQSRTPICLSAVTSLTLHTSSFNTQTIREFLTQLPELNHFGYSPGFFKPNVDNYLPFQTGPLRAIPNVSLSSLMMGQPPLQAVEIMRWWIAQLSRPSRAFVGVRTLHIDIEEISFDSTDSLWVELDKALSYNTLGVSGDPGAGGALESISIKVPRVAANAVRRLFPRTDQRGVLCV